MIPIYKKEFPFPGIRIIEIYQAVLDDDNSYYPIKVEGKQFQLRMNEAGFWAAADLSDEICLFVGDIVEREEL